MSSPTHPPRIFWTLATVAGVFFFVLTAPWHAPFAFYCFVATATCAAMVTTTRPNRREKSAT